jgi:uncharacterized protein (DUF433 family)
MSTSASQPAADQKLIDVPLFTLWDAAHYLRLSPWAVLSLSDRGRFPPDADWFFHHFHRRFPPPPFVDGISAGNGHPEDRKRISFRRLAEMFVRAFAVQGLLELGQREQLTEERWARLYEAVRWWPDDVPVFGQEPAAEGANRLLAPMAQRLEEGDLIWMEKSLLMRLDRVDLSNGDPVRFFPFSRVPSANSPRTIALDPRIRFGRPTIVGRGIPTDILFERHQAGDSLAELADDYDVPVEEIEEAIRYESAPRDILIPYLGW